MFDVARQIAFASGLSDERKKAELRGLLSAAEADGVEVSESELVEVLRPELDANGGESPSYSWVHLSLFRLCEIHDRCLPWHTESELRKHIKETVLDPPLDWFRGSDEVDSE